MANENKVNMMSLREAGKNDKQKGLREKLTGWGKVSKSRTRTDSATQLRKISNKNRAPKVASRGW